MINRLENCDLNLNLIRIDINKLNLIRSKNKIYFYRFFSPIVLKRYKKILYLDLDTIIVGNLNSIFNLNLKNYIIGAVKEPNSPAKPEFHYLKETKKRFNTGVILFNVKKWNQEKLTNKIIRLTKDKKFFNTTDQPVANELLYGKIKLINKKWNYLDSYDLKDIKNVKIIHFNRHKPWKSINTSPFKYLYYKYYQFLYYRYKEQPKYDLYNKFRDKSKNRFFKDETNFQSVLSKIKKYLRKNSN